MDFGEYLKKEAKKIDGLLRRGIPRSASKKWLNATIGKPEFIYDPETITCAVNAPLSDFIFRGGKRWRPALLMLCCEAVGGKAQKYAEFSILPEMAHNGTIIVDDVEDNSVLRRGKQCMHIKFGVDVAVNAGNLLYFLPLYLLYKNTKKLSEGAAVSIYNIYAEEMLRLSFGQATDILWHKSKTAKISEMQYLQMCSHKTGALSRMAAKVGAVLGNGTKSQIEALGNFAGAIGVAFQIQDDILNIFPKKGWGKETGDDISEGKQTLLVIKTLERAGSNDASRLKKILSMQTKNRKLVREAISIIQKYNAVGYAKMKAASLVKKSWQRTAPLLKNSSAKSLLAEFAQFLINREF